MSKRVKSSLPRFNIESKQDKKIPASIYLLYRYKKDLNGKNVLLKYAIREKIIPKYWIPFPTYRAKESLTIPDYQRLNIKLGNIYNKCIEIVNNNPTINIDDFKDELDYFLKFKQRPKTKRDFTFLEYFELYIQKSRNHERTILKYNTTVNHLEDYQEHINRVLQFNDIDSNFANDFRDFLIDQRDLSQNTLAKYISTIKGVMSDAEIDGYHSNIKYKKIGVKRIKTSKVVLELSELDKISKLDLTKNKALDIKRDLFLIACYTGLRYSDFSRLKSKHITKSDNHEYIQMYQYKGRDSKTDTEIIIPVLPQLKDILEKYDYDLPEVPVSQVMNRGIKEIVSKAKVNRTMQYKFSEKGKSVTKTIQIASKCTNHTARYTFINIMLNDFGVSPIELQKITGQTLKTLMGYERGDKKKNSKSVYNKIIKKLSDKTLKVV